MHTSYYAEYSLGAKVLLVLFTALVGALFIDGGAFVFNSIFGLGNPLEGYRSLGRFLLNLLAGEARFPENNFAQLPAVAGELAAGLTLHYLIDQLSQLWQHRQQQRAGKAAPQAGPQTESVQIESWLGFSG